MLHQDVPGCHECLLGAGELPIVQEPVVEEELWDVLEHDEDRLERDSEQEAGEGVGLVLAIGALDGVGAEVEVGEEPI